ncbi:MAG: hypothetical protein U0797_26185 [Gemmataceae bacterium]
MDSYPAITASVNHVRGPVRLPPLGVTEVKFHVGRGPTHLLQQTVGEHDVESAVAAYRYSPPQRPPPADAAAARCPHPQRPTSSQLQARHL